MAQIRIVDDWRRSPAAGPSHWRSVMVVAEKWAEQRVLMRAFAESRDQMLPTIMLHGIELAIGPAGLELNGPWGIHVGENPDGRAQAIKDQLEGTARRIAGAKASPPRLADEPRGSPSPRAHDAEPANWGPGAPRFMPRVPDPQQPRLEHVAPIAAARIPQVPNAAYVPQIQAQYAAPGQAAMGMEMRKTPLPRARSRTTRHPPLSPARTAQGYTSGAGAQSAIIRLGLSPHVSAQLGWLIDRVVPPEFHLDGRERRVLNALGERELTARQIGQMLDVTDPMWFMEELTRKLERYGVGLVEPGLPQGGEPTYRLRR
jgi:hypothetical protein